MFKNENEKFYIHINPLLVSAKPRLATMEHNGCHTDSGGVSVFIEKLSGNS